MDHFPGTHWGKPRDEAVDLYNTYPIHNRRPAQAAPIAHTQSPIVTGTSVLGFKYKDGVIIAADNLASYGSLARFKDIQRLIPVGAYTVVGGGGDMSDLQYIQHTLENLIIDELTEEDGHALGPNEIYEYLSQIMYHRRSKVDPLWNSLLVGGFKDGASFLGYVDLQGTTYSSTTLATGYGSMIAQPLLRKYVENREGEITEDEARQIIEDCMKVLFYRDARSLNKYQIATITANGISISESLSAPTEWSFAEKIRGYGAQTQ